MTQYNLRFMHCSMMDRSLTFLCSSAMMAFSTLLLRCWASCEVGDSLSWCSIRYLSRLLVRSPRVRLLIGRATSSIMLTLASGMVSCVPCHLCLLIHHSVSVRTHLSALPQWRDAHVLRLARVLASGRRRNLYHTDGVSKQPTDNTDDYSQTWKKNGAINTWINFTMLS